MSDPSGHMVPISQEMLDDAPLDIWNATIHPPSPLERARMEVEDAKARLEDATEALARAEDDYESQCLTPGADVRPEPFKIAEALGAAATAQLDRLNADLAQHRSVEVPGE